MGRDYPGFGSSWPGRSTSPSRKQAQARLRRSAAGVELATRKPKQARGPRRVRFARLLWLVILGLTLLLVGEIIFALFTSYRFTLTRVEVQGASAATRPLVLQQAPRTPGPNLFALRTGRLVEKLHRLSFVSSVALQRKPPGTLLIKVSERLPIAFFNGASGPIFVDHAGLAFTKPGPLPSGLVELQGLDPKQRALGRRLQGRNATSLLKGLSALLNSSKLRVKTLTVDGRGWLTVWLASGTELRLGATDQLERKLQLAELAIAGGPSKDAEYLDLSAPEAVVWKPRAVDGQNTNRTN